MPGAVGAGQEHRLDSGRHRPAGRRRRRSRTAGRRPARGRSPRPAPRSRRPPAQAEGPAASQGEQSPKPRRRAVQHRARKLERNRLVTGRIAAVATLRLAARPRSGSRREGGSRRPRAPPARRPASGSFRPGPPAAAAPPRRKGGWRDGRSPRPGPEPAGRRFGPRSRSPPGRAPAGNRWRRTPHSARLSRSSPAAARSVASTSPIWIFRSRVSTLPRKGTMTRSGRRASNWAARLGEEVPTRAPSGSASRLGAPTSRSHTSARSSIAAMASSGGRIVSTSFIEWTARSIRPSIRAESSSLVHSALPPISEIGLSRSWSPLVAIGSISISSGTPAMGVAKRGRHHPRLDERERRSAGSEAKDRLHAALVLAGAAVAGKRV